jgi:prevent-host-death family protein
MLRFLKLYMYSVQLHRKGGVMTRVSISELRANLLAYLKRVSQGESIEVSSKGRVLATLVPPIGRQGAARSRLDQLAGQADIGDVVSPTGESWEAEQ